MSAIRAIPLPYTTLIAAYSIFIASYFVFALGKFPGLRIDRPGAAIIGAVAMVAFRIVPPAMMAALGAAALLITRTTEPRKLYDEVDWGLLVFLGNNSVRPGRHSTRMWEGRAHPGFPTMRLSGRVQRTIASHCARCKRCSTSALPHGLAHDRGLRVPRRMVTGSRFWSKLPRNALYAQS